MLLAAGNGHTACCELLINEGADIQQCGIMKDTPLSRAAHNGHFQTCKFLLEQGAEVDAMDLGDNTPLHWARWSPKCVELLLKAGAALNARDNGGSTPFDTALHIGHRRTWPLFLRAGAEISPGCHFTWYLVRIQRAGGYRKYAQNHLAAMTKLFAANGRRLPPEVVRQIMKFWLHLGYY